MSPFYTIFNTVHAISDMNKVYKFQDIRRTFTRVKDYTDGRTGRQINRMHNLFPTVLESINNKKRKKSS